VFFLLLLGYMRVFYMFTVACSNKICSVFQEEDAGNNSAFPAAAEDEETETRSAEDASLPLGPSNGHHETFSQSQTTTSEKTRRNDSSASDGGRRVRLPRVLRSSLWTNCAFVVYCVVVAAVQGCIQSVLIFLPARGRELGAGANAAALLLTLFGVSDMTGRFIFGFELVISFPPPTLSFI